MGQPLKVLKHWGSDAYVHLFIESRTVHLLLIYIQHRLNINIILLLIRKTFARVHIGIH